MAKTGQRKDPHGSFRFKVEIEGVSLTAFRQCSGLKSETEVFEYQEGGDNETVHKLLGQSKPGQITLTKGYTGDASLLQWREDYQNGDQAAEMKRKAGSVIVYDDDNKTEVGRWNFEGAWPIRWEMGDLDGSGTAAIERLELAVSRISKGAPASGGLAGGGGGETVNTAAGTQARSPASEAPAKEGEGPSPATSPGPQSKSGKPGKASGAKTEHQCQGGHPVDLVTGAVVDEAVDLRLPGPIPFAWKRTYSSRRSDDATATLGRGWAHPFEQELWTEAGNTTVRDEEGRFLYFHLLQPGERSFSRGERLELVRDTETRYSLFSLDTRLTRVFEAELPGRRCRLRRIVDPFGNAIALHLHQGERLDRIVDSAGRELRLTWEAGRIATLAVAVDDQVLQSVRYDHSPAGCLVRVTDVAGHAETFEYDARHRMVATTTRLGVRFQYQYNEAGRCLRTWGPDGLYDVKLVRDGKANVTLEDGEEPRTITGTDAGALAREERPGGVLVGDYQYNQDGLLVASTGGGGARSEWEYDARGNLVREKDPSSAVTTRQYDDRDLLVRETSPSGLSTVYRYDERGALVATVDPSGAEERLVRDARGLVIERRDGQGGLLDSASYDRHGNRTWARDAAGAEWRWEYDALGRETAAIDPLGNRSTRQLDAAGNPAAQLLPGGAQVRQQHGPTGLLVESHDALGQRSWFRYAGMGVRTQQVGPDGHAWGFVYTGHEQLKEIRSPRGDRWLHQFDRAGRLEREVAFDGATASFRHDSSGNVSRVDHADGTSRDYRYDPAGNLVEERGSDGTRHDLLRDHLGQLVLATSTDAQGRTFAVRYERDQGGRVLLEQQGEHTVRYQYEGELRIGRTLPDGTETRYAYGPTGALALIDHAGRRVRLERDPLGRARFVDFGPVSLASSYDAGGRLVERRVDLYGAALAEAGSPPAADDAEEAPAQVRVETALLKTWQYDPLDRPVRHEERSESTVGRPRAIDYRYHPAGLLAEATGGLRPEKFDCDEGQSLLRSGWQLAPGGRLLQAEGVAFRYDGRGRRIERSDAQGTTRYTWDTDDQLVAVERPDGLRVDSCYDALGRRVQRRLSRAGQLLSLTHFLWDENALAQQIDEVPDSAPGGPARRCRSFVHADDGFTPLLQSEGETVQLVVTDHLGMPTELVEQDGSVVWSAEHSVFGEVWAEQSEREGLRPPFRLLGQVADEEAGLCFTRFRPFDPTVARWLSPDPLGFDGGPDLFGFNGSPTAVTDPLGLVKHNRTPGGTGAAHGAAASTHKVLKKGPKAGKGAAAAAKALKKPANKKALRRAAARPVVTLPKHFSYGKHLEKTLGVPKPKGMKRPHAHHILYKSGSGPAQKAAVAKGQKILLKHKIDPVKGKENLIWAPNTKGQHSTAHVQAVADDLDKADKAGKTRAQMVKILDKHGQQAKAHK